MDPLFIILVAAASLVFLLTIVIMSAASKLKRRYRKDCSSGIDRTLRLPSDVITETDLEHLPSPVRRYLLYAGVVGQPKVYSMRAEFTAEMRSRGQEWFSLNVEQHNFFDHKERFFFMKARVKGLPTVGYHRYSREHASMNIRILGLFPAVHVVGEALFRAETVTFFNDMCFLAPATLVDRHIAWHEIDSTTVEATFTHLSHTIQATLHFNEEGQLINFVSDDRYDVNEKQQYRFSTPLSNFDEIGGFQLPTYGEAIWHYPEGPFVYGKYRLNQVTFNIR
jgi:hypothetical protein